MKIFSLQSKTNLFVWAVLLGLALSFIVMRLTSRPEFLLISNPDAKSGLGVNTILHIGWPYRISQSLSGPYNASIYGKIWLINGFIWALVILVILTLIRHFRIKKNQPSS